MITDLFLNFVLLIFGAIFSILPIVDKLPTIAGYDIDGAMVLGMGYLNSFFNAFWAESIMFQGFLVIVVYYILKMGLTFFLGHRMPGHK
jgi:hypothetical protein